MLKRKLAAHVYEYTYTSHLLQFVATCVTIAEYLRLQNKALETFKNKLLDCRHDAQIIKSKSR